MTLWRLTGPKTDLWFPNEAAAHGAVHDHLASDNPIKVSEVRLPSAKAAMCDFLNTIGGLA